MGKSEGRFVAMVVVVVVLAACSMVAEAAEAKTEARTEAKMAAPAAAVAAGPGREMTNSPVEARGAKPAGNFAEALLRAGVGPGDQGLSQLVARNYKKMAQTILPLLVGFKATGMLVIAMALTKFVLLKALFLSTTALLIAALLALKKFLTASGQPHDVPQAFTYQSHDLSHMPYLHAAHTGAEYMEASQMQMPQVTYIGGSYGMQSMPYGATAGAGIGAAAADDIQGLYSSNSGSVAAVTAAQLQQLQQLQHQALLAQQQLGNANATGQQQQHQQPQQAGQLLQLSRRRLSVPQGATGSSPYPYRPTRPEARPA